MLPKVERRFVTYQACADGGTMHKTPTICREFAGMQGPQQQQSRSMFIQTSGTPNPASMMFLPGEKVMQVSYIPCCRSTLKHGWQGAPPPLHWLVHTWTLHCSTYLQKANISGMQVFGNVVKI